MLEQMGARGDMALAIALGLGIVGALLLWRGADMFADGAGDMARHLGVSALVIGIVLVGLEPEEMLTAAIASGRGAPGLALGDVIGTNITISTLALGLAAALRPIRLDRSARTQAVIASLVAVPPVIILLSGTVSRLAGVALLLLFAAYTVALLLFDRRALDRHAALEELEHAPPAATLVAAPAPRRDFTPTERRAYRNRKARQTALGLIMLAAGGPAIVEGATRFAAATGLAQTALGLTLVALATGAEMVALAIVAARRNLPDLLVGGIIGSFAYNVLVTLGLAAVVAPLPVPPVISHLALPVMVGTHVALLVAIVVGRVARWAGIGLIAVYGAYLIGALVAR